MNIFKARELQKQLCKVNKRYNAVSRIAVDTDSKQLFYVIIIDFSETNDFIIDNNFAWWMDFDCIIRCRSIDNKLFVSLYIPID